MNIHEHQAKQILKKYGVVVPKGVFAFTVDELIEKAKSLNPINIRTELGRAVFLYENIAIEKLSSLGEVRPQFIADLFVAIMNRSDQSGEHS